MVTNKLNRIKSSILGGVVALSAMAGAFPMAVNSSITASAAGSDDYAKILQYSLYFYDANMCGDNSKGALSWRSDCHKGDEVPGGFHDAGDHAMFGLPQGFTASTLGWSYYEFGDAFDSTGQTEHLKVITDHFCDFFKRSTKLNGNTVSSFLYQKGSGVTDHQYWGVPEAQESQQGKRKMYWTSNSASDIAADYAAALAFNYKNFGNAEDLKYAEALYKFSTQYNSIATDGPTEFNPQTGKVETFYQNSSCQDEQAWAAAALYVATGNQSYLNDAKGKLNKYMGWVHGWESVNTGAMCLVAEATNDWSDVNSWFSKTMQEKTKNGYYFLDKWGSARLNCSMQFTALVATKHSTADYTNWVKGQMDYITGNNPSGYSFIVGIGNKYPQNAHHRAASGYNGYAEMGDNTQAKSGSPVLVGALVGGPGDENGTYSDSIKDYVCNEVALDYNAGLVGAAAGLYSMKRSGSIATSIPGVTKIYSGSVTPPPNSSTSTTTTTTYYNPGITTTTTTTTAPPSNKTEYEYKPNQHVVYDQNADDKMIGWKWSEFGIPSGATIKKVEVNISSNGNIGKWEGAFGSSTTVAPDYWTMTDNMSQQVNGNSATITWNVPSATAAIIQTQYGGELKFGTWWINSGEFTVNSVKVYVDAPAVTTTTTTTTRTTTTTTTTSTTSTTTTTSPTPNPTLIGDANCDNEVNMADAVLIMQYLANPDVYGVGKSDGITRQGLANADCCTPGDGVTNADAGAIQEFKLSIIQSLPKY